MEVSKMTAKDQSFIHLQQPRYPGQWCGWSKAYLAKTGLEAGIGWDAGLSQGTKHAHIH